MAIPCDDAACGCHISEGLDIVTVEREFPVFKFDHSWDIALDGGSMLRMFSTRAEELNPIATWACRVNCISYLLTRFTSRTAVSENVLHRTRVR